MSPERIDQLARRMVLDILLESQASYWLRRADDFAKVGTPACDEIAKACANKATLCRTENPDEWADLLRIQLGDAA